MCSVAPVPATVVVLVDRPSVYHTNDMSYLNLLTDSFAHFIEAPLVSRLSSKVVLQHPDDLSVFGSQRIEREDVCSARLQTRR